MNNISFCEYEVDDFSGSVFDDLMVLGRLPKSGKIIQYLCKCSVCEKDPELFDEGYFRTTKAHLRAGRLPCGCSKSPRWNKNQAEIILQREANKDGFKLISQVGDFEGTRTRYVFCCPVHGNLIPKTFSDFMSGRRCIECHRDNLAQMKVKPDEEFIQEFFFSGAYKANTEFWRSERESPIREKYRKPCKLHWWCKCGECGEVTEHLASDLKSGVKGCSCGTKGQTMAYIHLLEDSGIGVALKFGISKRSAKRLKQQQQKTFLDISVIGEWIFTNTQDCKNAERSVKESLETVVVSQTDFKDGYTETTSIKNLEKIVKIYEDFGGVRK